MTSLFGEKIYKLTVSAGFTCPTRDGTRGTDGCAFCDERGSGSFYASGRANTAIRDQLDRAKLGIRKRFGAEKYLAYFQSFTNTYGPIKYLQEVYDAALGADDIVGMAVGTRPDCVPNEVLSLLNGYGRNRYVALELGLQSFRDDSLAFYQRGHTVAEGFDAVARALKFLNLNVSIHLMFGAEPEMRMPLEDRIREAIDAAKTCNRMGVHGVKLHQLMILKDTILARQYAANPWPLYEIEDYNRVLAAFLEHLDPRIHVERTHALSSHRDELVGPAWAASRHDAANELKKLLRDTGASHGSSFVAGASPQGGLQ